MELFSLGIGNYTETDVRESARAFTGWGIRSDSFFFDAAQHDEGNKTFLGQSGNFNGDDIIDIILRQPAAAQYISRRLFQFFAYDDPPPQVIARLAKVFTTNNRSIKAVVREILTSDEFYSQQAYRAKIKSPAELVASTIRTLEIETDATPLPGPLNSMGQVLFNPPDVSGWKGGAAWINSNTLLSRINFANMVATARGAKFKFSPGDFVALQNASPPRDAITYLVDTLLDGVMPNAEREILTVYLRQSANPTASTGTGRAAADERLRGVLYLVLAGPEYQLA